MAKSNASRIRDALDRQDMAIIGGIGGMESALRSLLDEHEALIERCDELKWLVSLAREKMNGKPEGN